VTRRLRAAAFALAAAALWLAPASAGLNSWEGAGETVDTPAQDFLRRHGKLVFGALPVVMFFVYFLVMGPADMLDAARRTAGGRRRGLFGNRGGFGSSGGFGGDPITRKNPWL